MAEIGGQDEMVMDARSVLSAMHSVMVSDRGTEHCNQSNSSEGWAASWHYIKRQIAIALNRFTAHFAGPFKKSKYVT